MLAVFGVFQMAVPYWLFTRGLRTVSPQEAAIITLIEPLLNPVWAYLITPEKDTPNSWMFLGGGLILLRSCGIYPAQTLVSARHENHGRGPN